MTDKSALDPQVTALLKGMRKSRLPPLETLSPMAARIQQAKGIAVVAGLGPDLHRIRDIPLEGPYGPAALRVYEPHNTPQGARPITVFIHGGGHVVGSIDTHDVACRHLALHAGCIIVSIDYHLAPEFPFPASLEDCLHAVRWVRNHAGELGGRHDLVAVAGDSAGANLATEICITMRDAEEAPLVCQLLFYPATDLSCSMTSHQQLADAYGPSAALLEWYISHYLSGSNQPRTDPRCSPLFSPDLAGLPPAIIVSAGFDPLRDESIAYHEKLLAHGTDSRHLHYPGMIHGFINMTGFVDKARYCLEETGAMLRQKFDCITALRAIR